MPLVTWMPEDWSKVMLPSTPILEIVVRGSIIYLVLYFGLRLVFKREAASLGIADLLVIVLIADAVQNGMAGGYTSVVDALILAGTIVSWSWLLSFVSFHFPHLRRAIQPEPLLLIEDGRLIEEAVGRELLTHDEIMGQLREQGVDKIENVKQAFMESNGRITVIPIEGEPQPKKEDTAH